MSNTPQRPFVPKRSTPERPDTGIKAEFRVVRPFVPGQARSYGTEPAAKVPEEKPLGSIADFLALDTPAAVSYAPAIESRVPVPEPESSVGAQSIMDYLAADTVVESVAYEPVAYEAIAYEVESDYELPPIEHFTDTVSAADPDPGAHSDSFMDPFAAATELPQPDPSGWGETDWQRYDWSAAAALGDAGDPAATSAWAQTDWGNPGSSAKDSRDSAAKAIADALDGIARRIRDGDLVFPPPPAAVPDPATIAATLAALLGVRR